MIHLVIAESRKGYNWFERKNDDLFAHSGVCCDFIDLVESNLQVCFRGSIDPSVKNNLQYIIYYPEISGSIPRTEKELNSVLEKEFKILLDLSKNKILYIFTTSEQVLRFFRIRLSKQEMKCKDLKVSFIEEFDHDENDFNQIDIKYDQGGFFTADHNCPIKMFIQTTRDYRELLRGRKLHNVATSVPTAAAEKSSSAP